MKKKYVSLEHMIRQVVSGQVNEAVGIIGSDKPKGTPAQYGRQVDIKPRGDEDTHPNKGATNNASSRVKKKGDLAQDIKMEDVPPNNGSAAAVANPDDTMNEKKKLKIKEDAAYTANDGNSKYDPTVPTEAESKGTKGRRKVDIVARPVKDEDPKSSKSKLGRQAAYKTNVIDEQSLRATIRSIMEKKMAEISTKNNTEDDNNPKLADGKTKIIGNVIINPALNKPLKEDMMVNVKGGQAQKHTVTKGQTLSDIAKDKNVSVADIAKANPDIKDLNKISVGQTLNMPKLAVATDNPYKGGVGAQGMTDMSNPKTIAAVQNATKKPSQPPTNEPIRPASDTPLPSANVSLRTSGTPREPMGQYTPNQQTVAQTDQTKTPSSQPARPVSPTLTPPANAVDQPAKLTPSQAQPLDQRNIQQLAIDTAKNKAAAAGAEADDLAARAAAFKQPDRIQPNPILPTSQDQDDDKKTRSSKVMESRLIANFLKLQEAKSTNIFESAKKLSDKQKKIAALAGDKDELDAEDFKALRAGKKVEEETDLDEVKIVAPLGDLSGKNTPERKDAAKEAHRIRQGGKLMQKLGHGAVDAFNASAKHFNSPTMPHPKRGAPILKAKMEEEVIFSDAELAHLAAIAEAIAKTDAGDDYGKNKTGTNDTVSNVSLTDEIEKRGRGRPKGTTGISKRRKGEDDVEEVDTSPKSVAAQIKTGKSYFNDDGKEVLSVRHPVTGRRSEVGIKHANDFNTEYQSASAQRTQSSPEKKNPISVVASKIGRPMSDRERVEREFVRKHVKP